MSLREYLQSVQANVRAGQYTNEPSVSQGIVLPILQMLDWQIFDTKRVCPEYSLAGRRVDFALCHPQSKPQVFIEVKKVGESEGGDRQLFEYAFHQGVPMAVLTDGQEWHFYLPGEQGAYDERRVYKLDILERELDESELRLKRYLGYKNWSSGLALTEAREDYRGITKNRQIKLAIPQAWEHLLHDPDELLIELLVDQVEDICGFKPDSEDVVNFITGLSKGSCSSEFYFEPKNKSKRKTKSLLSNPVFSPSEYGFILHGVQYSAQSARDVMTRLFEILSDNDPSFMERFASRKHGKKRRYISMQSNELYPDRPDLCQMYAVRLKNGWWMGTNYSRSSILSIINMACEVAELHLNKDIFVYLGQS